ncbi:MAG: hypothetical protein ABI647_27135 [Gemmatimonadota bacterium]
MGKLMKKMAKQGKGAARGAMAKVESLVKAVKKERVKRRRVAVAKKVGKVALVTGAVAAAAALAQAARKRSLARTKAAKPAAGK